MILFLSEGMEVRIVLHVCFSLNPLRNGGTISWRKNYNTNNKAHISSFEIDTVDMTISINENKFEVLVDMVQNSVSREKSNPPRNAVISLYS